MRKLIVVLVCALGMVLLATAAGAPVEIAKQAAVAAALKSVNITLDAYCTNVIPFGSVWVDPGFTMIDAEGRDISDRVTQEFIPGPVDTSVPWGVFQIVHTGLDDYEIPAEAQVRVVVVEGPTIPPVISLLGCAE